MLERPQAEDFVTIIDSSKLGLDYAKLESKEYKILRSNECPLYSSKCCAMNEEGCSLVELLLPPEHPCYEVAMCYLPSRMKLRQVSHEEHIASDLILEESKEDIIIFNGEKFEVIKDKSHTINNLDDLIF